MTRKLFILLISFSIILFIGSYFAAQYLNQKDKIEVTISVVPQDSKITINGKLLQSNKIYLQSGKYMISVIKDGYFEYRKLQEVNSIDNQISTSLNQKPEKTIGQLTLSNDYNLATNIYPIIKHLPYDSFLVKIAYSPSSTLSLFSIDITAYEGYRKIAVDKIKNWGYNPADFDIKFLKYENPFKL